MNTSSSAGRQAGGATVGTQTSGRSSPTAISLSERSITGYALVRIFVGYLWFQQLFWKMPPDFTGLYHYIVREAHFTIIPGYGSLLQHTFLAGCPSMATPAGCAYYVPLATGVWLAELVVALSLMFGLFTRLGAILSVLLASQLYVGLAYAPGEWYWTYGMLVLLGIGLVAIPAGRRLGVDQWLAPRLHAENAGRLKRFAGWFV